MHTGADPALMQRRHQRVAREWRLRSDADGVEMTGVAHACRRRRGRVEREPSERVLIPSPLGLAEAEILVHSGELVQTKRGLEIHHVVLEARNDTRSEERRVGKG